jgi:hypothetical protein
MARVFDPRNRTQKSLGIGHLHRAEKVRGGCLLNNLAAVHNHDFVGPTCDDAEIMTHENHRHVTISLEIIEKIKDLCLNRYIESCCGLIGEEDLWATRQCDCNRDSLAHAA